MRSNFSSEIQKVRHERDHLAVHRRNLEIETPACQNAGRPIEAMAWINEIESAKSIADLTTSHAICRANCRRLQGS